MNPAVFEIEARVQSWHWWFTGRRRLLRGLISALDPSSAARILEVGTGTGSNLRLLRELDFTNVIGLDVNKGAAGFCAKAGLGRLVVGRAPTLPFPDAQFRLVLATDLLEHLEEDERMAKEIYRILAPGGAAVITVPAQPFLWGLQDEVSHHKRRYTRGRFTRLIESSGLRIRQFFYFNYLLLGPIWLARRIIDIFNIKLESENQVNTPIINAALQGIFHFDVWSAPKIKPPWGVTLLAVAEKEARASGPIEDGSD